MCSYYGCISAFSGSLVSALTSPRQSMKLDSFQELANSHYYEFRVPQGTSYESLFQQSPDPLFQKIGAKLASQKNKYTNTDAFSDIMVNERVSMIWETMGAQVSLVLTLSLRSGKCHQ